MSLPVWEEWIEIQRGYDTDTPLLVSSRMGRVDWNANPYGKLFLYHVSSRMGRVDWNKWYQPCMNSTQVSSRMGRVDWNGCALRVDDRQGVSSRMGRVDWNDYNAPFTFVIGVSSRMGRVDWNILGIGLNRQQCCLFPYGKSGLKLQALEVLVDQILSLPVWEEWIEINIIKYNLQIICMSLPVWEEWIEILAGSSRPP